MQFNTGHQQELAYDDFLWGWLNVNTRCLYHDLSGVARQDDKITLAPMLDLVRLPPFLAFLG